MTKFTAPTTYTEAKALMGTEVETSIGLLKCTSAGMAGSEFHLGFYLFGKVGGTHDLTWSSSRGWETLAETRTRVWNEAWDKTSAVARRLIEKVLGDDLDDMPVERRKTPSRLLRIAKRRLIKSGAMDHSTCNRCGGTGNYSYCELHGTTCFGCNGSGKVLPTSRQALLSIEHAKGA